MWNRTTLDKSFNILLFIYFYLFIYYKNSSPCLSFFLFFFFFFFFKYFIYFIYLFVFAVAAHANSISYSNHGVHQKKKNNNNILYIIPHIKLCSTTPLPIPSTPSSPPLHPPAPSGMDRLTWPGNTIYLYHLPHLLSDLLSFFCVLIVCLTYLLHSPAAIDRSRTA